MRGLGVLVVVCLIVSCATPILAQDTTGRMMVRTSDAAEAPLPGVAVTIASPSLIGGARTQVTDDRGEALFLTLGPGTYEVKATLHGFATQERREVWVRLGSLTALNVIMPEATFEGEIEVFDETPVVDPQQIGTEQVFDADYIEKTAIGSWQRFAASPGWQVPGITGSQDVLGSTEAENAWFLDGIEVTQSATGNLRSGAANVGIDAYQEIEVKTGGFEAEYGRALGGVTSIVMKSGGNRFSGSLNVRYQPDAFQEGGDHFDPDLRENRNLAIEATLGGPIVRDRLWFFAAFFRGESDSTPEGSPTTWMARVNAPKAKLTWQINPAWRGAATYFGNRATFENLNASRWTMPEAASIVERSPDHLSIGIDGMLSHALLWTSRIGYDRAGYERQPMSGDLETISHFNVVTRVSSENYRGQEWDDSERVQIATDLTWFLNGTGGSHELKIGLEMTDTNETISLCSTGTADGVRCSTDVSGYEFADTVVNGEVSPLWLWEQHNAGPQDTRGLLWVGYIQDAWRPMANLTIKAGVRFDSITYDMERTGTSVTMDRWQPRLGLAWDIGGNTNNVLRASAGRYMDPATMNLPWFGVQKFTDYRWWSCSAVAGSYGFDPSLCAAVAADFGWWYRETDPANWDPYGWALDPGNDIFGGVDQFLDPGLESAYSDQFILGFERTLWPRSSLEASLVFKRTRGLFEDTCNGNLPEPQPDAECSAYIATNLPQLERDYRALILRMETRALDWLTVLASYTLSESKGNHDSLGFQYDWDFYPWHWENRSGYMSNHYRHHVKLNGYVLLPLDFTIAFNAGWRSPFKWTPELTRDDIPEMGYGRLFTEPRGEREGSSDTWLDLQFSKGFRIGPTHLDLIVSVLNALSKEEVTGVCELETGCGDFQLGEPTDWDTPRAWEVGLRLTF